MIELIKFIPCDIIINVIEPFTRSTQNPYILQDIISFTQTIFIVYRQYCVNLYNIIDIENENINKYEKYIIDKLAWYFLEIDLHCFIIQFELYDGFLELMNFSTFLQLLHISDLATIIEKSEYKKTKQVVYKLWGFLSISQREQFMEIHNL